MLSRLHKNNTDKQIEKKNYRNYENFFLATVNPTI